MVLGATIALTLLLAAVFLKVRKQIRLFEGLFLWFVISMLTEDFITLLTVNLKWVRESHDLTLFWSWVLLRSSIQPLVIALFVNSFLQAASWLKKGLYFLLVWFVLQALNWVGEQLGLFHSSPYPYGLFSIEWAIALGVAIGLVKGYRRLVQREVRAL